MTSFTRRELLVSTAGAALMGAAVAAPAALSSRGEGRQAVPKELDNFIRDYMREMDAPGLTLALADARGTLATAAYGWVDPAARLPVTPAHRFQIGSISKSFAAIAILQLQDEHRLDVHDPVFRHLPWLAAETAHGEITLHHLLTHTSGMPSDNPVFPDSPGMRPRQASAPGSHFHYSNWAYGVLGYVVEALDGGSLAESLRRRIFAPLGMNDTIASIGTVEPERVAPSFVPLQQDRPVVRGARLVSAPWLIVQDAAGCIVSTPADMARFAHMLINHGATPSGRLISERAFELLSTRHTPADEFGAGAGYGYGLAIDELDGHRRLRHTGGMVSFMSSLQVDLDAGLAAFASVNAQLGYRPNAVTQYALRLLRAKAEGRKAPPTPPADDKTRIEQASDYAGTYRDAGGRTVTLTATAGGLTLSEQGRSWSLQVGNEEDAFAIDDPAWMPFLLQFMREPGSSGHAPAVVELGHGERVFRRDGAPAAAARAAADLGAFVGTYHSEDPWRGTVRILARGQRLWLDGSVPLDPIGPALFRLASEPDNPETCEFTQIVNGKAQLLINGGVVSRRLGGAAWPA